MTCLMREYLLTSLLWLSLGIEGRGRLLHSRSRALLMVLSEFRDPGTPLPVGCFVLFRNVARMRALRRDPLLEG